MSETVNSRSSFVESYLDANKRLAKTMVIKSGASAELINERIILENGESAVDKNTPKSWKYYLNISGEYHPLDTLMSVTSLDTLTEIAFTKANLKLHTATAAAYAYGSRYYYSLLDSYPEQEQLILGILYPVDIMSAIAAEEGSILGYPEGLVEEQELTLINDLERFIKNFLIRWNVQAFGISNPLYNAAYHAVLYLNILPKLLNLRLARCKTNEAHSFHIREYLASHAHLDAYYPYLTMKQALFFYRNINYLLRNAGKTEQFELLIEKILTDRGIPLSEFSVRQLGTLDENYYPGIVVRRKAINTQVNAVEKSYLDLEVLKEKELSLAYGNPQYYEGHFSDIQETFQTSASSVMQTKDLESAMVDYNDSHVDPLSAIKLRELAYMTTQGYYNVIVNFKDPVTGELRSIYAQDAFLYLYYATLKMAGAAVTTVPRYITIKYRKKKLPTIKELVALGDSRFRDLEQIAAFILEGQPAIGACWSSTMFHNFCYTLFEQSDKHWRLISNTHDEYKRGIVANMVMALYEDSELMFENDGENIDTWLYRNNLPSWNFSHEQAKELIANIFAAATGTNIDETKLLKNIQKNMLALFAQLSSYSIQLISEVNSSNIIPLNWPTVRLGHPRLFTKNAVDVRLYNPLMAVRSSTHGRNEILVPAVNAQSVTQKPVKKICSIGIPLMTTVVKRVSEQVYIDMNRPQISTVSK